MPTIRNNTKGDLVPLPCPVIPAMGSAKVPVADWNEAKKGLVVQAWLEEGWLTVASSKDAAALSSPTPSANGGAGGTGSDLSDADIAKAEAEAKANAAKGA